MGITDRGLELACSAIGAGLALIAGIGPGVDRATQQDMVVSGWKKSGSEG